MLRHAPCLGVRFTLQKYKLLLIIGLGVLLGAIVLVLPNWLTPNSPSVIFQDGKVKEILNCESIEASKEQRCNALRCMKEIYERGVVEPYSSLSLVQQTYAYEVTDRYMQETLNLDNKSEHYFESDSIASERVVRCEILDDLIQQVDVIEKSQI